MKNKLSYTSTVESLVSHAAFDNYQTRQKNPDASSKISNLNLDDLIAGPVLNKNMARCALSGLWLLHNELHQSHEISQSIKTPEGSWWHAIMHRIEGDFWNSKYWYRKVGRHAAVEKIEAEAGEWDPDRFVDQCESGAANTHELACLEWKCLFDFCLIHSGKQQ